MKTLIIAVTLIVLAAVVGVIVIGTKSFEGIVVERPYETGLLWDSAQKEKASLGWEFHLMTKRFVTGENIVRLKISDKEGKSISDAEVSITVSRPSTNAYDKVYAVPGQPGGMYQTVVQLPLFGYWDMNTRVKSRGKTVVFPKTIFAEKM
jgi:nitrogen fixation protein FixH